MAGEAVEGDRSPAKPDQAVRSSVVEGSVNRPAPAKTPGWFELDMPYEVLVGNLRQLIQQARERHQRGNPDAPFRATEPFEPAEWLGWYLHKEVERHINGSQTQRQIFNLANAWDALYSARYPSDGGHWREWVKDQLGYFADTQPQPSITLPQRSVTLLDAMAEAAGLPRKKGEATIDLTPFTTPPGTPPVPRREIKSMLRHPTK